MCSSDLRFNDALDVSVELQLLGASQIKLKQTVARADEALCTADVRIACVSMATMKPVRIPKTVIESLRNQARA